MGELRGAELREMFRNVQTEELTVELQKAAGICQVGELGEVVTLHVPHPACGNARAERHVLHAQIEREPGILQLLTNGNHAVRETWSANSETGNHTGMLPPAGLSAVEAGIEGAPQKRSEEWTFCGGWTFPAPAGTPEGESERQSPEFQPPRSGGTTPLPLPA